MANLTITVDEEILRKARVRALERGTSVNRVLAEYLEIFAGAGGGRPSLQHFVTLARQSGSGSGARGRRWSREELHERGIGGR